MGDDANNNNLIGYNNNYRIAAFLPPILKDVLPLQFYDGLKWKF